MNLIIADEDVKEVLIAEIIESHDKGTVIIKGENQGKRNEGRDDIVKEITALDTLEYGATVAAKINGTGIPAASRYAHGHDIADDDTRAKVLAKKYEIADTATAKLMETLGLLNPSNIEKEIDKFKAASLMAGIVDKVAGNDKKNGQEVHLHLYAPKQKSLSNYEVIEVEA